MICNATLLIFSQILANGKSGLTGEHVLRIAVVENKTEHEPKLAVEMIVQKM